MRPQWTLVGDDQNTCLGQNPTSFEKEKNMGVSSQHVQPCLAHWGLTFGKYQVTMISVPEWIRNRRMSLQAQFTQRDAHPSPISPTTGHVHTFRPEFTAVLAV